MWKRYTAGAYTLDCELLLPVSGTVSVTGYTETTHYTIDYTTPSGILTMLGSPSPAAPTAFTCEYDLLCRFGSDDLGFAINDIALVESQPIEIVEEPL
jgi:hypothetical protein